MLGFDNNGSNSAQESNHNGKSNDSSDNFSANKPSTSKKMAKNIVVDWAQSTNQLTVPCPYGSRRGV